MKGRAFRFHCRPTSLSIDLGYIPGNITYWPQETSKAWAAVKVCDTMPGDVNGSGGVPNLPDIIYLVNYVFDKSRVSPPCNGTDPGNCWTPAPLCGGEIDGTEPIDLQDIINLVNYVFDKDRPLTGCLGIDPGNCWTPVATKACCLPVR